MAKHLIDSDLYIDLIHSRMALPILQALYESDASGIYFSSVVIQELLAGVRGLRTRSHVETLYRSFERAGRIIT